MTRNSDDLVLLYDGVCGFCDHVVQFVIARDDGGTMHFAALQGAFARGVLERHPQLAGIDSLVLVRNRARGETVQTRSSAVVAICVYLGGPWTLLGVALWIVPWFIRDAGYAIIARVRYRIWGRYDACNIPTPAQRARFLD